MQQLEGKTAIVTGAASGIGLGMARSFAREGMAVVLCDIRGDRLDAALGEVRALGAKAIAVVTDVSDRASVRARGRRRRQGIRRRCMSPATMPASRSTAARSPS